MTLLDGQLAVPRALFARQTLDRRYPGRRIPTPETLLSKDRDHQSTPRHRMGVVHVCIDDASRIAFTQIKRDERKESAVAFLQAAVAYYK
jgi:hypothetical protein